MSMLDRLSEWIAERQEKQLVRKTGGAELTSNGVSLSAFMEAFDMPEDTRARMEAMAENYGLPRTVLETESGRALMMARACGECRERGRCRNWLDGKEPGTAVLAFLVSPDKFRIGETDYHIVIIPTAPVPFGGAMVFVPVHNIRPADMSVDGLMSIYLSMGVSAKQHINE